MATRNKKKLAASNKENCEEHPRSNLAQNSNVPRSQEDYIAQVSEEIEGRVTRKLSQEISRTENHILGALARIDDFLMDPLTQGHSGTYWNVFSISQGTNEDNSHSNLILKRASSTSRGHKTLAQKTATTPISFPKLWRKNCYKSLAIICRKQIKGHVILILHEVKSRDFLKATVFFSGITALKAFCLKVSSVSGVYATIPEN